VLGINLLLVLCIDSKSLYECLVKLGITQEKRLIIDIICLRQAYKHREIVEVKWIKGKSNLVNAMTKSNSKSSNALKRLIDTNILQLDVEEWVERE
jgi:predicted KAP-like P-loop ATPase